jgi:uroporphyrinogen-III synthase
MAGTPAVDPSGAPVVAPRASNASALPLAGLGVLVTRPAAQAEPLCQRLAAAGATVWRLPALAIEPLGHAAGHRAAAGPLDHYRRVIFVSVNAVVHGVFLLETARDSGLRVPEIFAIGPATADALAAAGHAVALPPGGSYDSETLLASPELQQVAGEHILIVRGEGGREHLAQSLRARGATVHYADVYRRVLPATTPLLVEQVALAEQAITSGALHVVTATSSELLDNTLRLFPDAACLSGVTWLAGSRRIGQRVRELGFQGPVIVAERPDDAGLVGALEFWRKHQSAGVLPA